jgi:hypothetical protein
MSSSTASKACLLAWMSEITATFIVLAAARSQLWARPTGPRGISSGEAAEGISR